MNLDKKYELIGCVNDILLTRSVLEQRFGFQPERIVALLDEQASYEGVTSAMRSLTERIGKDDVVFFQFSGHGGRRTTDDPTQSSGKNSTLVTYDSGRGELPNLDIPDVDIQAWLGELAEKTRHITLVFDCCHSER